MNLWREVDDSGLRPSPSGPHLRCVQKPLRDFCRTTRRFSPTSCSACPNIASNCHIRILQFWWREVDSNHRRRKPADLQSAPVGRLGIPPILPARPGGAGVKQPEILAPDRGGVNGQSPVFPSRTAGAALAPAPPHRLPAALRSQGAHCGRPAPPREALPGSQRLQQVPPRPQRRPGGVSDGAARAHTLKRKCRMSPSCTL